jgi:hypothetical protein
MKPDKATVYEIFQLEKRYVVPLYQRPYVWTREEQWEPLWKDIEDKAKTLLLGKTPAPHFLGAIVLSQIRVGIRQIAASLVIDGQQRLTTLQVFLAAFRDVVVQFSKAAVDEEATRTLATISRKLSDIVEHSDVLGASEDRFKVWPTNADRTAFESVMTAGSRPALDERFPIQFEGKRKKKAVPGPNLVETYRFFDEAIRTFVDQEGHERKDTCLNLFGAISRCLQLVVIDLDEGDDPQVIFETLNARGEPLLASDLIRNLVFARAGGNADALYASHWKPFDEVRPDGRPGFWKQEVKVGRETRFRLDLFFQHFLSCRAEQVIPLTHLYREFRAWWQTESVRSANESLDEVRRFSDVYSSFFEPETIRSTDRRLSTIASRLLTLDTSTVYPLLLFLVVEMKGRIPPEERDQILTDLESFLVRRSVCNITSKNYNRFFSSLLTELRGTSALSANLFRSRLAVGSGVDRWPDDKDFENAWLRDPVYERLKSPGVQMVLRAIHDAMLTRKQEPIAIPALTVEHVMPSAWRNHWPAPAQTESATDQDETAEERRDRIIHSFGNLTILTQALNSGVRDSPFEDKRLEITKSLLLLNAYFRDVTNWDETAILVRGRQLFEFAKTIWPRPSNGSDG